MSDNGTLSRSCKNKFKAAADKVKEKLNEATGMLAVPNEKRWPMEVEMKSEELYEHPAVNWRYSFVHLRIILINDSSGDCFFLLLFFMINWFSL